MHEMPVTQGILNLVLEYAGGHPVTDVYLKVGRMSPVVPDSVDLFFEYLSKDTLAEGAKLHFEVDPVEMTCQTCGQKVDLSAWADERPQLIMAKAIAKGCPCGSKTLRVTGGVAFGVVSISVVDDPKPADQRPGT
jgi:hydrogenase nickel incorporation protein HypA/HybF